MVHIKKRALTCEDTLLSAFCDQATATVHEAMGRRGAMDPSIKPIARGMRFCGRALTVQCHPGDNLMLVKAIGMAQRGDVIVADMGPILSSGPFGEVLATECMAKGVEGLVLSGGVRDSREIIALGFPVFSAGLSICGTVKAALGRINHPICCGGEIVRPGDIVLGDDDGVVIIPPEAGETVLKAAKERTEKEAFIMERLRKGESLFDIYGYQTILESLHCIQEA